MSAWVVGLAIAAGYLINKNLVVQSRLTQAEAEYQGVAKPATGGVTSAEVRKAWKNTDYETYGDFNADWSQQERDRVVASERQAAQTVQAYDERAEALPQIQGVMLTFDRYG
jgi:hypothetical protein